jgi:hypothetical protein
MKLRERKKYERTKNERIKEREQDKYLRTNKLMIGVQSVH